MKSNLKVTVGQKWGQAISWDQDMKQEITVVNRYWLPKFKWLGNGLKFCILLFSMHLCGWYRLCHAQYCLHGDFTWPLTLWDCTKWDISCIPLQAWVLAIYHDGLSWDIAVFCGRCLCLATLSWLSMCVCTWSVCGSESTCSTVHLTYLEIPACEVHRKMGWWQEEEEEEVRGIVCSL